MIHKEGGKEVGRVSICVDKWYSVDLYYRISYRVVIELAEVVENSKILWLEMHALADGCTASDATTPDYICTFMCADWKSTQ